MISSVITGTGSYIPKIKKENKKFLENHFLNSDGTRLMVRMTSSLKNLKPSLELRKEDMPYLNTIHQI